MIDNLLNISPSFKLSLWVIGIILFVVISVVIVVNLLFVYRRKHNSTKVYQTKKNTYVFSFVFIIFAVYAITLIYPFLWLLLNSVKDGFDVVIYPFSFPKTFMFSNYVEIFAPTDSSSIFAKYNVGTMFFNSITLTFGAVFVGTLSTTLAAYTMAKYEFKGRSIVHTFIILCMTIPTLGSLPATYKLMINTQLKDTYVGMMLMMSGGFGGHYLYMFAYFKGLSWSYAESAMIDGANQWKIFVHIMIPLAMPMVSMIMILKTLGYWNDYWMPYLFYSEHPTLAVGLQELKNLAESDFEYGKLFAAMVVATVPIILFYIAFQKRLMSVTIGGGVKG